MNGKERVKTERSAAMTLSLGSLTLLTPRRSSLIPQEAGDCHDSRHHHLCGRFPQSPNPC